MQQGRHHHRGLSCTASTHIEFGKEGWNHTAAMLRCQGHGFIGGPGMDGSKGLEECHNGR